MFAHVRRDGVFPRPGNFRRVFKTAVRVGTIAAAVILASPVVAGDATRSERLDTEHLFGFVEGADIGDRGQKEFISDSSLRAGKGGGKFADTTTDFEIKYTAFENVRISTTATLAWYEIAGVPGIGDTGRAALQSLSFDARFRVLDRAQAPFGLTVSLSPHWGFFDETSGVRADHTGGELQALADREIIRDQLAGAVNLLFANDRVRLLASDSVEKESLLGVGGGLAAQILPGIWFGGEARYLRDYSGAALNAFSGQAVFAGPTVYVRLGQGAFASAAWDFQVRGGAVAAPGALDLANFERYQAKFRIGLEF